MILKLAAKSFVLLFFGNLFAQTKYDQNLFLENHTDLSLKLKYSNKQVKRNTDKQNGIKTDLIYTFGSNWDTIPISLRARGNFRRANCYFPPIKMYIGKNVAKGTPFKGQKKLKIVLPCTVMQRSNDDIIKEYLAYKIYELVSDFHFRTRLATLEYIDTRGEKSEIHPLSLFLPEDRIKELFEYENDEAFAYSKPKKHQLKAILIEDDKKVAKRHNAKVMKRFVHPLNQAELPSITNAFFQFMIGNTDFSTAYQHNQKLIFLNGKTIPLPYDFDMSGLVDASYAVVSVIQDSQLDITDVKDRKYRGFKRDLSVFKQVRELFLDKKPNILQLFDSYKSSFEDKASFLKARNYILSFYNILENDDKYAAQIVDEARIK